MITKVELLGDLVWQLAYDEPSTTHLLMLRLLLPTQPYELAGLLTTGKLKLVAAWLLGPIARAAIIYLAAHGLLSPTEIPFVGRYLLVRSPLQT